MNSMPAANSNDQPIELEPLGREVVAPNRRHPAPDGPGLRSSDTNQVVPNRAGHHCPDCDYDLRGLSQRVCPECGHEFTLAEARHAGLSRDPRSILDFRVMRARKLVVFGCFGLLAICFIARFAVSQTWPTWGDVAFLGISTIPFAFCGFLYCYSLMRSADEGLVLSTLLYVAFFVVVFFLI